MHRAQNTRGGSSVAMVDCNAMVEEPRQREIFGLFYPLFIGLHYRCRAKPRGIRVMFKFLYSAATKTGLKEQPLYQVRMYRGTAHFSHTTEKADSPRAPQSPVRATSHPSTAPGLPCADELGPPAPPRWFSSTLWLGLSRRS